MFLPTACHDGLTVRELTDETIVYDLERHKVHCLNRTAGLVWKHCDGQTTVSEIAAKLKADQSVVQLALEQLGRRKLLQEAMPLVSETARRSRREVLKQMAVVAVALPAVLTISSKSAATTGATGAGGTKGLGQSCVNFTPRISNCAGGLGCCNGVCVDTSSDPANCGSCGFHCPITESCVLGQCTSPEKCTGSNPGAPCAVNGIRGKCCGTTCNFNSALVFNCGGAANGTQCCANGIFGTCQNGNCNTGSLP